VRQLIGCPRLSATNDRSVNKITVKGEGEGAAQPIHTRVLAVSWRWSTWTNRLSSIVTCSIPGRPVLGITIPAAEHHH
jgi:hypothetical protein